MSAPEDDRNEGSPPIEEWEHPLNLLGSRDRFLEWIYSVESAEAEAALADACRNHMRRYGTRSILDVTERLDDRTAEMEEWSRD